MLTGLELLTFTQTTALISQAVGREVAYRSVTPQRFARELLRRRIPRPEAALLATVFTTVLGGRNAHLTTDVHQILGRRPRTFGDYVRKTGATGVWEPTRRVASRIHKAAGTSSSRGEGLARCGARLSAFRGGCRWLCLAWWHYDTGSVA